MGRFSALVLLWTVFVSITFELEMSEKDMKAMKGKFCGSHLADMLSLVCDGVYNNKQKKSVYTNKLHTRGDYEDGETLEYPEEPVLSFPFRSKERAKSLIPVEFRKRSKGIVNECCYQPCSLWEMSGYCGKQ